jgi:hypothetical protein
MRNSHDPKAFPNALLSLSGTLLRHTKHAGALRHQNIRPDLNTSLVLMAAEGDGRSHQTHPFETSQGGKGRPPLVNTIQGDASHGNPIGAE